MASIFNKAFFFWHLFLEALLHILEEQTPKKIKKFVAQKQIQNGH
jgi:hypothetical protein